MLDHISSLFPHKKHVKKSALWEIKNGLHLCFFASI
jgi:hypothetical protein